MATLAQDAMLGDRYRLVRRIAIGGMGEVWRAEDIMLHRPVAVKVLKTELSVDPTFLERFRNEARSAAAFSHAGIAGVFDYGETDAEPDDAPTAYLVMELVDGEPLSAILAREGRLTAARTLDYVGQAAAALQVAHRTGMVHRDIKPGNLLIAADGQVKITDFGIARAASTIRHTQAGMVVGTAQYFSPEQAEGRVVGPASDVYSLGVVAYECLAGHLPFTADSPVTVAVMQIRNVPPPLPPDVPPPVRAMVERAMAKDARWRYTNGGELAAGVAAAQAGRFEPPPMQTLSPPTLPPTPLPPPVIAVPGPPPPPVRPRRRWLAVMVGAVILLVAVGVVVWLVVDHRRGQDNGSADIEHIAAAPDRSSSPSPRAAGGTRSIHPGPLGPSHAGIEVDPGLFVGRPVQLVIADLRNRGLRPIPVDTGDAAGRGATEGTVKSLMTSPGHVLHAPTLLPTGSEVLVVSTAGSASKQHIVAGSVGTFVHPEPLLEQQGNR